MSSFVFTIQPLHAQKNAAARYEIDAKRIGVSPTDKDALPRSREFIRLDSTYYVGWQYEGIYKFERSSDYLGYKYAIPSLQKSLNLLEKDYGNGLKNIYSSFVYYSQYQNRLADFFEIVYSLEQCYNSLEMPDSVMSLLDKVESYHFQKDYFGVYTERAWTYHRNRFFTSEKFDFLKNSVEENEKMAFKNCYRQLESISKNKAVNDYWYGPNQSEQDILGVDHYLALLYCYNQNYDSSQYYYNKLVEGNRVLWGNYAGMEHEIGNIDSAISFYSMPQSVREHSLSEPAYFLPTLFIYGGKTKEAISLVRDEIDRSGSTPGFGWYNIALARSYLYDGQLDSADFFLSKAANFKELHINTTLTQSQYDFTINLLKVQLIDKKIKQIKFLNKGWWYSISDLYDMLSLKVEKLLLQYVVVNELANNPERKRIVYDLFCAESTVSFDETMYLLKDFSTSYFENKYETYQKTDKRGRIQRYFKLFTAKFKLENGKTEEAISDANDLLTETLSTTTPFPVDTANEKLYLARLYEVLANAHAKEENAYNTTFFRNVLFEEYPQLIPFSDLKIKMRLTVSGLDDAVTKEVINNLKDCNIDWTSDSDIDVPEAIISFDKKGKSYQATIDVKSGKGKSIVSNQQLIFKKPANVGKELALRLFAKGGGIEFQE
jgi:tetratricopeptide (TPR) repeat protein